jgi:lipopolysaccharide cholinephosphotransferase
MENEQLRDIQLIELEILKEVVRVCNENGIQYFLDSGTALGAVRHQGFIPWDDDIDIGMTRENYDRFLEIAPKQLSNKYFLQNRRTDKNTPYTFAKVRKNNTIFMEWNKRNLEMHHGIYIDIFPYDNVPDDDLERKEYLNKCNKLNRLFVIRTTPDRDVKPAKSLKWLGLAMVRRVMHILSKVVPLSTIENKTSELFRKYNDIDTKGMTCHSFPNGFILNNDDLYPIQEIKFEDDYFNVPNNVNKVLQDLYGDYQKLPPIDQRVGHGPYKVKY